MLSADEPAYCQPLTDGLVMRTAASSEDVERVAQFNGVIHGPGLVPMTRALFLNHPHTRGRDLIFVEDEKSGQVISSLCLIPWTLRYEGVDLPAGEMAIVGTLEGWRRRGLIRAQVGFFKQRLQERQCLLSHIQGIPYYYRQFGYEYALPLEGGLRLELRHIPKPPETPFTFRLATLADLPTLMRLYNDAAHDLDIATVRDEAIWRYLLQYADGSDMEAERWLIEDSNGRVMGYAVLPKVHFGAELTVNEVSRLSLDACLALLNHLKGRAEQLGKPGIRLCLPANCSLMQVARPFTDREYSTYAWQIHVPDVAALLRALAPVFERRIARSLFAGLTREVQLCLYRETIALHFVKGKLVRVINAGNEHDRGDINIPPLQFIPFVLGYRSLDELRRAYPDVSVAPSFRLLVDTLFPKVSSFLYTVY